MPKITLPKITKRQAFFNLISLKAFSTFSDKRITLGECANNTVCVEFPQVTIQDGTKGNWFCIDKNFTTLYCYVGTYRAPYIGDGRIRVKDFHSIYPDCEKTSKFKFTHCQFYGDYKNVLVMKNGKPIALFVQIAD